MGARDRSRRRTTSSGATYTPGPIIRAMLEWGAEHKTPERVVDPGTGSARFLLQAGKTFPKADLLGVDIDPLAALLARANLVAAGLAKRSRVVLSDYRRLESSTTL